jgi:predicted ATP-dependent serine protease
VTITLFKNDGKVETLRDVVVPQKFFNRMQTGVTALDTIFGGESTPGILRGTAALFTGMPGAGKSTMALQLADVLKKKTGMRIFYNVGEENKYMVKIAADRIGIEGNFDLGKIEEVDALYSFCLETRVDVLFVDSLQSMHDGDLSGAKLLKSVTKKLISLSKDYDITVIIIGHITKGGGFAGPQELVHDVDAHMHLQLNVESGNRILEMRKNRFGPSLVPYEFALSANGLDFTPLQVDEQGTGGKIGQRREQTKALIKEQLLAGEKIGGYCFQRLGVNCSGGFWRGMLKAACDELKADGHVIGEVRIEGKAHSFLEV